MGSAPRSIRGSAANAAPADVDLLFVVPSYAADPDAAARGTDVRPAGSAAMADGLKPLAISHTAMTQLLDADGSRQDKLRRREVLSLVTAAIQENHRQ